MTRQRSPTIRHLRAAILLIAVLTVLPALAAPEGSRPLFMPAVTYSTGAFAAFSVAVADVNGDGKPDLLVANQNCGDCEGVVSVLLGNGDGTFQPPQTYDSGGQNAFSIAVADVNGDGKPDLLVANLCTLCANGVIGVLLGNGDGTFQAAQTYNSGGIGGNSVAVADVNGDGKPDLLVAIGCETCPTGGVSVLLGNGNGTFQAAKVYSSGGSDARSVAVADVNGDRKPDLLVANENGNGLNGSVGVLLGNGDGTFQAAVSYSSGGGEASSLAVADVNGDDKLDLLVADVCLTIYCTSGAAGVLLGNGDGTFQAVKPYSSGSFLATSIAVADVNGDTKPDLLVANWGPSNPLSKVSVLLGNGDGTFQKAQIYNSGGQFANAIAAADVNGDGKIDLLVANEGGGEGGTGAVGVLLNNTPFCTTPPVVTVSTTPAVLWPPNGNMIPVTVSGTITDTGCTVTSAAYAVTDEYGQVQPGGTVTLGAGGAYSFIVLLQASRLGTDLDGRLYTITVSASNNAGKTGSQAGSVIVPHDQGH